MVKKSIFFFFLFLIFFKAPVFSFKKYYLKVKLAPKVVEEKVYWQDRKDIDWRREIKNWHFGFLSLNENLPPLIIYKENFYPPEESFSYRFRWMSNEGVMWLVNLLRVPIKVDISFEAVSFQKKRDLEIWVNGEKKGFFEIPASKEENKFVSFTLKNIILNPGINKIFFYTPQGTEKLKKEYQAKKKEVSIKFKDNFKISLKEKILSFSFEFPLYKYVISQEGLNLFVNFNQKEMATNIFLLSQDVDIDLEEFPFCNFEFDTNRMFFNVELFLGIDFDGDGYIDGFLNPQITKEVNLFEMAKKIWSNIDYFEHGFGLRKIVILLKPTNQSAKEIGLLTFKNICFYNENSLIVVGKRIDKDDLKFEGENVKFTVLPQEKLNIISYFDGAPIQKKGGEEEKVEIYIPIDKELIDKFPYLSFFYKIENPKIQKIKLFLLFKNHEEKISIISLPKEEYDNNEEGKIEINLKDHKNINDDILQALIVQLKRKDEIDCSNENKGWYRFQINKIHFCKKFPYPLKDGELIEEFLSLIKETNPKLVKIDEKDYYLNDFKNWHSFEDLEKDVLVKLIRLTRGNHTYKKYRNSTFEVKWTILEPIGGNLKENLAEPQITFKKINPTKYLVKVEKAKNPFWLVFSESFHKQWRLYKLEKDNPQNWKEIVADYPHLKVKEARHLMKFTPQDIKYLFKKPLSAPHLLVNGYANGWFIEPKKLGLGENFILVIYFWPQSLFYLGLGISGITFLFCIIYLLASWIKKNKICRKKSI